jgi:hypothetical protein
MLDTGLGIAAGYESDEAMVAAVKAEREAMAPEVRDVIEDIERRVVRAALFGSDV